MTEFGKGLSGQGELGGPSCASGGGQERSYVETSYKFVISKFFILIPPFIFLLGTEARGVKWELVFSTDFF